MRTFHSLSKLLVDKNKSQSFTIFRDDSLSTDGSTPRAPLSGASTPRHSEHEDVKQNKTYVDLLNNEECLNKLKNNQELTSEEKTAYDSIREEYSSAFEDNPDIKEALKAIRIDILDELNTFHVGSELDKVSLKRKGDSESDKNEFSSESDSMVNKKVKSEYPDSPTTDTSVWSSIKALWDPNSSGKSGNVAGSGSSGNESGSSSGTDNSPSSGDDGGD